MNLTKLTLSAIILLGFNSNILGQVNTLKESIFFPLGKTSLTQGHKKKLDSIVILLQASSSYNGEIKGYTCNIGSTSINKMISNLRALSVYNYLVDKGAKKESFTYGGFGATNPMASNSTEEGRKRNRRTDIELLLELLDAPNQKGSARVASEYTGIMNGTGTTTSSSGMTTEEETSGSSSENSTGYNATKIIGPSFTSGKLPAATATKIQSTNGIELEIDRNTFITTSKEELDIDFKDYSQNADVLRKGIQTKGQGKEHKLYAAFSANVTQEYQDLEINPGKPLLVTIPGEYDPSVQLYSNHKNWMVDTVNKFTYDETKKAYIVSVINKNQMLALMKPIQENKGDTLIYLRVKIKGLSPEHINPYVIYDDCSISRGYREKGKYFIFPITKLSDRYRLRAAYTDFSSKSPQPYSLNFDVTNLAPVGNVPARTEGSVITMRYPSKIMVNKEKLHTSSLCESEANSQMEQK